MSFTIVFLKVLLPPSSPFSSLRLTSPKHLSTLGPRTLAVAEADAHAHISPTHIGGRASYCLCGALPLILLCLPPTHPALLFIPDDPYCPAWNGGAVSFSQRVAGALNHNHAITIVIEGSFAQKIISKYDAVLVSSSQREA